MADMSRLKRWWAHKSGTVIFVGIPVTLAAVLVVGARLLGIPQWVAYAVWFGLLGLGMFFLLRQVARTATRNSIRAMADFASTHGWEMRLPRALATGMSPFLAQQGVQLPQGPGTSPLPPDPEVLPTGATRPPFDGDQLETTRFLLKQHGEHLVECYSVIPEVRVLPTGIDARDGMGADGKVARTVRQAGVVQVRLPGGPFPWVQVSTQELPEEADALLGGEDIVFESDAFNRRFRVKGDDQRFSHDLIAPLVMQYLLDTPWPEPLDRWSLDGDALLWWCDGTVDLEVLPAVADFIVGLRAVLPDHLLQPTRD